jgi:Gluconate 2-dehydrogenase subunit 3
MNRRIALKQVMLAAAAAALLPGCSFEKKKELLKLHHLTMDEDQAVLLGQLVDTLLPETAIAGAQKLGVDGFLLKMVDDCSDKETQDRFVKGLTQLNGFSQKRTGKTFSDGSPSERKTVLEALDSKDKSGPEELLSSFPMIKQLTIQGFMTSQMIMTDILHYEQIPGRFHGCVDVVEPAKTKA